MQEGKWTPSTNVTNDMMCFLHLLRLQTVLEFNWFIVVEEIGFEKIIGMTLEQRKQIIV